MIIGIANDHRGVTLKENIINYLNNKGYMYIDYGTNSSDSVDYVDYATKLCDGINNREIDKGILICGTGIGMSIAANKIDGIRCARVCNVKETELAVEHNMANVIAIGEDTIDIEKMVDTFINTKYSEEERHKRRVNKIMNLE
jgi:ribose 5-phosphate isomerase B